MPAPRSEAASSTTARGTYARNRLRDGRHRQLRPIPLTERARSRRAFPHPPRPLTAAARGPMGRAHVTVALVGGRHEAWKLRCENDRDLVCVCVGRCVGRRGNCSAGRPSRVHRLWAVRPAPGVDNLSRGPGGRMLRRPTDRAVVHCTLSVSSGPPPSPHATSPRTRKRNLHRALCSSRRLRFHRVYSAASGRHRQVWRLASSRRSHVVQLGSSHRAGWRGRDGSGGGRRRRSLRR